MATKGGGGGGGKSGAIRAGRAFVELTADDAGLRSGLQKVKSLVLGFGKKFAAGGGVLAGLGSAIVAPIAASIRDVLDHFDKFSKAADRTGATTEALSALAYAAEQSDASLEDVANGTKFLQKTLSEAAAGGKEAKEALAQLGLKAEDLKGLALEDQFARIADGLAAIEDPADRTNAALSVLGRGGLALLPMLKDGGAALKAMTDRADRIGDVVKGEDAKNATRIGDALSDSWKAVANTFRAVGAAILPHADTIESLTETVITVARAVRLWVADNRALVLAVGGVGLGLMALGAVLVGVGTAFAVAAVAAGGFAAAFGVLTATPVLVAAALAVAGVAAVALVADTQALGDTVRDVGDAFRGFAGRVETAWGGMRDAMASGDMAMAAKIAWSAVGAESARAWGATEIGWTRSLHFFEDGWDSLVSVLTQTWHQFADDVEDTTGDMVLGMFSAMIDAVDWFKKNAPKGIQDAARAAGWGPLLDVDQGIGAENFKKAVANRMAADAKKDNVDRINRDKAVNAELDAKRKKRQEELDAQIAKAEGDVDAARAELNAILAQAKAGAVAADVAATARGLFAAAALPTDRRAQAAAAVSATVRGGFGGHDLAAKFGGGTVEDKQLGELKEANRKLGRIEEKVGGVAWD